MPGYVHACICKPQQLPEGQVTWRCRARIITAKYLESHILSNHSRVWMFESNVADS